MNEVIDSAGVSGVAPLSGVVPRICDPLHVVLVPLLLLALQLPSSDEERNHVKTRSRFMDQRREDRSALISEEARRVYRFHLKGKENMNRVQIYSIFLLPPVAGDAGTAKIPSRGDKGARWMSCW